MSSASRVFPWLTGIVLALLGLGLLGGGGPVNLWAGMRDPRQHLGEHYSTSPPVVAHDLVIIGGEVTDNYSINEPSGVVRAYGVTTGRQLWEDRLPAGAQATPMTYRSDKSGRQFLVVVAGGHGSLGTKAGDSIIAYALPRGS